MRSDNKIKHNIVELKYSNSKSDYNDKPVSSIQDQFNAHLLSGTTLGRSIVF